MQTHFSNPVSLPVEWEALKPVVLAKRVRNVHCGALRSSREPMTLP